MTSPQIHHAAMEWYGATRRAYLAMAEARLQAGDRPESWG